MEQRFELDLRMSESGIVCNAMQLKEVLPEKLKPYNYVVTENNYADAKKDRTKLNNLLSVFQDRRKQFEEVELGEWKSQKAILMDIEKMIKSASDVLGEGIKTIDENEKIQKMEEVKGQYVLVAQSMPLSVDFEKFYDRKQYDKKTMTVKKILEDMQIKIDKCIQDWEMLKAYLPNDEADIEQVKKVFSETLNPGMAKAKADELKAIRQRIEQQKIMQAEQEKKHQETVVSQPAQEQPMQQETVANQPQTQPVRTQRIMFEIIAERPFFDDMNQLILKHRPQVKVIEKEEI